MSAVPVPAAPEGSQATTLSSSRLWTLWFALPVLACLIVYWKALNTWFLMDDYAWLGLRLEVHSLRDLWSVLFRPQAQGTVRVLSERVFFLSLSSVFGNDALPFRLVILTTQFANLVLMGMVARRITGSRVAAIAAPLVWTFNSALVIPMSWISTYNEILWAFCLLVAFYSFLRYIDSGSRAALIAAWTAYLAGFGVLELNVLFPPLLLLYTIACARAHWRKTLPFFLPAIVFAGFHLFFVPKSTDQVYRMYFDGTLIGTLWTYVTWAFGPSRLGSLVDESWRSVGYGITGLVLLALLSFAVIRTARRDFKPLFLLGWFLLILLPVLPLKNHVSEYYLTVPTIGLAILAGSAFACALRRHWLLKLTAFVVLAAYSTGMYAQIQPALEWRLESSQRLRTLLESVAEACRRRPADVVLLSGVDWDVYAAGFNDQPFRLYGIHQIYLTPETSERLAKSTEPLRGLIDYRISPGETVRALESGKALVLQVQESGVRNVTRAFQGIARAQFKPSAPRHIDAGLAAAGEDLGPTWYPVENGFRWMPEKATVRLAGPQNATERLFLKGFVPKPAVANGPITLTVRANGMPLGSARFERPDSELLADFALPAALVGQSTIDIELAVDHTFTSPNDPRKLGLIFGVIEIAARQ